MSMNVPNAFNKLSNPLHQDLQIVYESLDATLADCPTHLNATEKLAAKQFLGQQLSDKYAGEELPNIWNDKTLGCSGGFCNKSGILHFLTQLRSSLIATM